MHRLFALVLLFVLPVTAQAQSNTPTTATADPALTARAAELVAILNGAGDFEGYFTAGAHTALPREKWDAILAQIGAQMGRAQGVDTLTPVTPWSARVRMRFDRGTVNVQLAIDPVPPHGATSIYFTGAEMTGDSIDKLTADFGALPGGSGFGVFVLGDGAPRAIAGINATAAAPLGSAFKLWVLGELARSINAGERRWADVVPVGSPSLPSGMTQSWPAGTPVTLQTLAVLMISISDNTATDTLVTLEGVKLDRFVADAGAPGLAPMLTTRQMFAIKSAPNADLAARWAAAPAPARRALLDASAPRLAATPIDAGIFAGKPVAIDTLEWFASPAQTAMMLDRLRAGGGGTALAILAVNPGVDDATRAKFAYVGFKGGSEPGVITLNYLIRRTDGRWLAVVGNWHRADAAVDATTFAALMTRALILASGPLP